MYVCMVCVYICYVWCVCMCMYMNIHVWYVLYVCRNESMYVCESVYMCVCTYE